MSNPFSLSSGFFDDARALVSLILPSEGSNALSSVSPGTSGYFTSQTSDVQSVGERREYVLNLKYKKKYDMLKQYVKNLLVVNVAYCDEIADIQDKIFIGIGKRRFLTKKLLNYQTATETYNQLQVNDLPVGLPSGASVSGTASKKTGVKRKTSDLGTKTTKETIKTKDSTKNTKEYGKGKVIKENAKLNREGGKPNPKPKKVVPKSNSSKKIVRPIPVDSHGRPIFPIVLRDLTIHSLGEIVHDRPAYHTKEMFFPVGFCSSRVYGSIKWPEARCVYTCKVLDGGPYPKFQISAEGELDEPLVAESPNFCHLVLIQQINQYFGTNVVSNFPRGPEFFGFNHPMVLNLLQSMAGSKKCLKYKSTRFEVSNAGEVSFEPNDPRLNFEALQQTLQQIVNLPKPGYRVRFEEDCY